MTHLSPCIRLPTFPVITSVERRAIGLSEGRYRTLPSEDVLRKAISVTIALHAEAAAAGLIREAIHTPMVQAANHQPVPG